MPETKLRDILPHLSDKAPCTVDELQAILRDLCNRRYLSQVTCDQLLEDYSLTRTIDRRKLVSRLQRSKKLTKLIAEEFSELPRIIFIHIPKCGGQHVAGVLRSRFPILPANIDRAAVGVLDRDFLTDFLHFVENAEDKRLVLTGHRTLKRTLDLGLLRETDHIFSFFRDPINITISWVNYVLSVLCDDKEQKRPDNKRRIREFGLSQDLASKDPYYGLELLRNPSFLETVSNVMCQYLGDGTAESAIEMIESNRVEMTPLDKADDYLLRKWGIPKQPHTNVSKKFISEESLPADLKQELHSVILKEDYMLFDYLKGQYVGLNRQVDGNASKLGDSVERGAKTQGTLTAIAGARSKFDTVYLHIGLDKTGSTALQSACDENRSLLDECGVLYPEGRWHAQFGSLFYEDPKRYRFNIDIGRAGMPIDKIKAEDVQYLAKLEQQMRRSGAKTMVLSFEGFPQLQDAELQRMHEYLQTISASIKVIMYCRDPVQYAASAMSQRAKSGRATWKSPPIHRFRDVCERFVSVFGGENLVVREFAPARLLQGDVRIDFFKQIGLSDIDSGRLALSKERRNESLSAEAILIAEALREMEEEKRPLASDDFPAKYASTLEQIHGARQYLTKAQRDAVVVAAKEHVQYLREHYNIDFSSESKNESRETSAEFGPDFVKSIAQVICSLKAGANETPAGRLVVSDQTKTSDAGENPLLVFVHIPKTAGSAFRDALRNMIGNKSIYWYRKGSPKRGDWNSLSSADFLQYKVVGGHRSYHQFKEKIGGHPAIFATLLRDPVRRAVSYFQYINRPGSPHGMLSNLAKRDLKSALDVPRFRNAISNAQCKMIAGIPSFAEAEREIASGTWLIEVDSKINRLLRRVSLKFGWPEVKAEPANVGAPGYFEELCTEEIAAAILELNQEDMQLFNKYK